MWPQKNTISFYIFPKIAISNIKKQSGSESNLSENCFIDLPFTFLPSDAIVTSLVWPPHLASHFCSLCPSHTVTSVFPQLRSLKGRTWSSESQNFGRLKKKKSTAFRPDILWIAICIQLAIALIYLKTGMCLLHQGKVGLESQSETGCHVWVLPWQAADTKLTCTEASGWRENSGWLLVGSETEQPEPTLNQVSKLFWLENNPWQTYSQGPVNSITADA